VRCINHKRGCKKNIKKDKKNVCDGGDIKHGSDCSYVCDAGHTVDPYELFAIRQKNRNGQPYQCVCDTRHAIRSDELFATPIRECNRNGQPNQGVCDIRHTVQSNELFSIREENINGLT
jgi:hypothetical protein